VNLGRSRPDYVRAALNFPNGQLKRVTGRPAEQLYLQAKQYWKYQVIILITCPFPKSNDFVVEDVGVSQYLGR
jgi:hypothetical protein